MKGLLLATITLIVTATQASAFFVGPPAPSTSEPVNKDLGDSLLNWKISGSFFLGGELEQPRYDSAFNVGNNLYQISSQETYAIARLNLELNISDQFSLVARPRGVLTLRKDPETQPSQSLNSFLFDGYFQELYATYHFFDHSMQISAGRQNFEWGPAETLSPSNFFFPQLLLLPRPFDEIIGETMVRLNISLGQQWSWILLGELPPERDYGYESPGVIPQTYQQRYEGKLEFSWDNSAKYMGLTLGRRRDPDRVRLLGGGYFSFVLSDAVQIYGDAQLSQGSVAAFGVTGDTDPTLLSVVGLKYTMTDGTDLRLESIYNQVGYTPSEQSQVMALTPQIISDSSATPSLPGLSYLYASIRSQSPGVKWSLFRQPAFGLRSLISLTDGSSISLGSVEAGFSDSVTAYLYGGACGGSPDSELHRIFDYFGGVAVKASF